ncbi:MAG: alpha/beta fold hydrolase [Haloarculaceae archaeon]
MERTDEFLTVDGTELHYSAWGDADAPPVVCMHGLSRVGRDFDPLARALADEFRVLCPDAPGRGLSAWADDPADAYTNGAMADLLVGFCDALGLDRLRWVGTSMGGGLGIALAGGPLADRITHLVVNDVSPDPTGDADPAAIDRIGEYVGDPPTVETVAALEAYYRDCYEGRFSPMTDAEWHRFTATAMRRTDDGDVTVGYDPRIVVGLADDQADDGGRDPYDVWAAIDAAVMILHGTDSGVLTDAALGRMLDRQPDATVLEVDSGHAPSLNVPAQTAPVRSFLVE